MPPGRETLEHFDEGRGIVALWFGMLAGPAAWFLHLNISYSLVRYVCYGGSAWLIHLATAATLLLAGAGLWVAYRSWKRIGEPELTTGSGVEGRTRFMALSGIALSGFFLAIIVMGWIPDLILEPCGGGL